MNKEFLVTILGQKSYLSHNLVERTNDFDLRLSTNLQKTNNKITLTPNAVEGYYESLVYNTLNFNRLVGSWAAVSSVTATVELQIRVRVNNIWSPYLTYNEWGLGRQNSMNNQTNDISRMLEDEILITNNQVADGIQYKYILRRTSVEYPSPELSLVSLAFTIPNYQYPVDVSNLPTNFDHDVPKLYQHDISGIGGIICSPTSSTMLLMYRGQTFNNNLPHGITAPLFYDHGNKIY